MQLLDIPLTTINLHRLTLVKEVLKYSNGRDLCRWIFRAPCGLPDLPKLDIYIKIWNPSYVRASTIKNGLETGFYDSRTAAGLVGLISHAGICRGYVMHRCRYHGNIPQEFRRLIEARTASTGFFLLQYSRHHIMKYRGQTTLIDLEGIYPLDQLPVLASRRAYFDDPEYARYVHQLFRAKFPDQPLTLAGLVSASGSGAGRPLAYRPLRKIRAAFKLVSAWIIEQRGLSKDRLALIER